MVDKDDDEELDLEQNDDSYIVRILYDTLYFYGQLILGLSRLFYMNCWIFSLMIPSEPANWWIKMMRNWNKMMTHIVRILYDILYSGLKAVLYGSQTTPNQSTSTPRSYERHSGSTPTGPRSLKLLENRAQLSRQPSPGQLTDNSASRWTTDNFHMMT